LRDPPLILVDTLDLRLKGEAEILLRYFSDGTITDPRLLAGPLE